LKSSIITYSKSKNLNCSILIGDALLELFDDILCLPASIPSPTIKNSRFCAQKQEVKQINWFQQMTKQQHHHSQQHLQQQKKINYGDCKTNCAFLSFKKLFCKNSCKIFCNTGWLDGCG
jgi:hypothetical protein